MAKKMGRPLRIIDPGSRFTRLTVLQRSRDHISPRGAKVRLYLCRCDCGTVQLFRDNQLWRGKSRSCGCLRRDLLRARFDKSFEKALLQANLLHPPTVDSTADLTTGPQEDSEQPYTGDIEPPPPRVPLRLLPSTN